MYHRVCQSLICSSEKSEPHLFPYSRVVVHFVACCGYNVDRCSFAPKDGVSRQKTRPNVFLPSGPMPNLQMCQKTTQTNKPVNNQSNKKQNPRTSPATHESVNLTDTSNDDERMEEGDYEKVERKKSRKRRTSSTDISSKPKKSGKTEAKPPSKQKTK